MPLSTRDVKVFNSGQMELRNNCTGLHLLGEIDVGRIVKDHFAVTFVWCAVNKGNIPGASNWFLSEITEAYYSLETFVLRRNDLFYLVSDVTGIIITLHSPSSMNKLKFDDVQRIKSVD